MIKALKQYLRDETWPRAGRILSSAHLFLAILLGIAAYRWGGNSGLRGVKIGEVASALLTYGAIVLGFSLAGLTLALTLPDRAFAKKLASHKKGKPGPKQKNSYSDLLFIFSWTAIVHWVILVTVMGIVALRGYDHELLPADASNLRRAVVAALAVEVCYGVCQFLVTLITLSQVGQVYIDDLNKERQE